jgi:ribosomal protein L11 methyltransferase
MTMVWRSITIRAGNHQAMALCEALLELGAASVFIEEDDRFTGNPPVFAEAGEPVLWAYNKVNALVSEDTDIDQLVGQAGRQTGHLIPLDYSVTTLDEQDWVKLTQSQFQPMHVLPGIWVVPSWHEPVDRQALNLMIDPGPAFGTGSHASTRLCLKWLAERIKGGEHVVDYGCGSGILSIGAKLLGAAEVMGLDIDPLALQTSCENARRNQVEAQFFSATACAPSPG